MLARARDKDVKSMKTEVLPSEREERGKLQASTANEKTEITPLRHICNLKIDWNQISMTIIFLLDMTHACLVY